MMRFLEEISILKVAPFHVTIAIYVAVYCNKFDSVASAGYGNSSGNNNISFNVRASDGNEY